MLSMVGSEAVGGSDGVIGELGGRDMAAFPAERLLIHTLGETV